MLRSTHAQAVTDVRLLRSQTAELESRLHTTAKRLAEKTAVLERRAISEAAATVAAASTFPPLNEIRKVASALPVQLDPRTAAAEASCAACSAGARMLFSLYEHCKRLVTDRVAEAERAAQHALLLAALNSAQAESHRFGNEALRLKRDYDAQSKALKELRQRSAQLTGELQRLGLPVPHLPSGASVAAVEGESRRERKRPRAAALSPWDAPTLSVLAEQGGVPQHAPHLEHHKRPDSGVGPRVARAEPAQSEVAAPRDEGLGKARGHPMAVAGVAAMPVVEFPEEGANLVAAGGRSGIESAVVVAEARGDIGGLHAVARATRPALRMLQPTQADTSAFAYTLSTQGCADPPMMTARAAASRGSGDGDAGASPAVAGATSAGLLERHGRFQPASAALAHADPPVACRPLPPPPAAEVSAGAASNVVSLCEDDDEDVAPPPCDSDEGATDAGGTAGLDALLAGHLNRQHARASADSRFGAAASSMRQLPPRYDALGGRVPAVPLPGAPGPALASAAAVARAGALASALDKGRHAALPVFSGRLLPAGGAKPAGAPVVSASAVVPRADHSAALTAGALGPVRAPQQQQLKLQRAPVVDLRAWARV